MARTVSVYHPSDLFPSVSVTGRRCKMSCRHCNGHYLNSMVDVSNGGSLYEFGTELAERDGIGMLISGGCDQSGKVPINDYLLKQIKSLKNETDLILNLHTGLVSPKEAAAIAKSGVDVVSLDLVGDDQTIIDVLGLDKVVEDYRRTYRALKDSAVTVVPHILAGFHFGILKGELKAIDIASDFDPERSVLILLVPTRGTPMENVSPLKDSDIINVAKKMREKLRGDLILGCMRPRGNWKMESDVLDSGFDGIVLPARKTKEHILKKGWKIKEANICCASDLDNNTILI